jgi:hypothetical protein
MSDENGIHTPPFPHINENTQLNNESATLNRQYTSQNSAISNAQLTFNYFKARLGFNDQKSTHNWEQREFRVFNYNHLFGGKFSKDYFDTYLNDLKHKNDTDPDNTLEMYEKFSETDELKISKQNESVINIAIKKVDHLIHKREPETNENEHELRTMRRRGVVQNQPNNLDYFDGKFENRAGPCDAFACNSPK